MSHVQEGAGAALCGYSGCGAAAAGHGPRPAPGGTPHPEAAAAQLLPRSALTTSPVQCTSIPSPVTCWTAVRPVLLSYAQLLPRSASGKGSQSPPPPLCIMYHPHGILNCFQSCALSYGC